MRCSHLTYRAQWRVLVETVINVGCHDRRLLSHTSWIIFSGSRMSVHNVMCVVTWLMQQNKACAQPYRLQWSLVRSCLLISIMKGLMRHCSWRSAYCLLQGSFTAGCDMTLGYRRGWLSRLQLLRCLLQGVGNYCSWHADKRKSEQAKWDKWLWSFSSSVTSAATPRHALFISFVVKKCKSWLLVALL